VVSTTGAEDVVRRAKQVAEDASKAAGEALRELHGQTESVEYKSDKSDIVTEADYKADNIITTVIENEFPYPRDPVGGERRASRDERVHLADRSARRHGEFRTWKPELLDLHRASGGRGTRNGRRLRAGDR